jgi:hypothetical protein
MISIVYMYFYCINRIGGVMVNVFASRVVDRGFELQSGQTKECKIGICCFSSKKANLRNYFLLIILGRFDWLTMPCKTRSLASVFMACLT